MHVLIGRERRSSKHVGRFLAEFRAVTFVNEPREMSENNNMFPALGTTRLGPQYKDTTFWDTLLDSSTHKQHYDFKVTKKLV